MYHDAKSTGNPNASGLNSIARNAIRLSDKLEVENPNEITYHVLATLHVWKALTYDGKVPGFERFKFFYENGYGSNLIIRAGGKEISIADYAAYMQRTSKTEELKEDLGKIAKFASALRLDKNDNAVLEVLDYEDAEIGPVSYNYFSRLGKCSIVPDKGGGCILNFPKR